SGHQRHPGVRNRCGHVQRNRAVVDFGPQVRLEFVSMWMAILSFLGGQVIKGLIDAYQAKLKAGNVESKIAADLAAGEIAAQTAEMQAQTQYRIAEIGHWYEPDKIMGYLVALLLAKLVAWDI